MMETKRLILRPWQESDAEALFRYASEIHTITGGTGRVLLPRKIQGPDQ